MKLDSKISLFFIILFNTFLTISSQDELKKTFNIPDDSYCLKLILYNNGTLERQYVLNNKGMELFSITSFDKIILYDCLNDSNGECSYRNYTYNDSAITKDDIQNKKSYNKDFFNCNITEKYYKNNMENITNYGCIQIDKKEYERFKGYNLHQKGFIEINETRTWELDCYAHLYYCGKYNYISIFILFYFLLF